MDFGLRIVYVFDVLNTGSAAPNYPGCCGTTCARIDMQRHVRHAAWKAVFVSCCILSYVPQRGLFRAAVLLYYYWQWSFCCTIVLPNSFVHCMVTYHKKDNFLLLYSVPTPHTFLRLFGLPSKYKLCAIRQWDGKAHLSLVPSSSILRSTSINKTSCTR